MDIAPKKNVLIIDCELSKVLGLKEAIVLQQIHYWLHPSRNSNLINKKRWVYNTYEQWREQIPFWSDRTLQRIIRHLEKLGVIISFTSKKFDKTKFYTIDYGTLKKLGVNNFEQHKGSAQANEDYPIESQTITMSRKDVASKAKNSPNRAGKNVQIEDEKTSCSYNTETTSEITSSSSPSCVRKKKKQEVSQRMLEVWDQVIHQQLHPGKKLFLTSERERSLLNSFKSHFESKLGKWTEFCNTIAKSPFLMGRNSSHFRVSLEWALRPKITIKILEGFYYSPPSSFSNPQEDKPWEDFMKTMGEQIPESPHREAWLKISTTLANRLGQNVFNLWLSKLTPRSINEKEVHLIAPNCFFKNFITQQYGQYLEQVIREIYPKNQKVLITEARES